MYASPFLTALLALAGGSWLAIHSGHGLGAFTVGYTITVWLAHWLFGIRHESTHKHALLIAGAALLLLPPVRRRVIHFI